MSNEYHDPEFPEGEYTINGGDKDLVRLGLKIRTERSTKNGDATVIGRYFQNGTFTVYQVFPAEAGIVWGRVSSNTQGTLEYCGLKVDNHRKVVLIKANPPAPAPVGSFQQLEEKVTDIRADLDRLIIWAMIQGYKP